MYESIANFFENSFLGRYSDLFKYYSETLRRWNNFSGRVSLTDYWLSFSIAALANALLAIPVVLIMGVLSLIFSIIASAANADFIMILGSIIVLIFNIGFSIMVFIPQFSLLIRRLHDVNKSALWLLTLLCCGLGIIPISIFILGNSVNEGNKFGPADPYQIGNSYSNNNSTTYQDNTAVADDDSFEL